MMKKVIVTIVTLALCGGVAYSQGITSAYNYSQTDLTGTARSLGMAGAFGALGGDVSAMKSNPAGLGVYRSSEIVSTLSLNMVNAESSWLGNKQSMNKTNVSFDNFAYVGYFPTGNYDGLVSWTAGFAYNRLKNFRRNYTMTNYGGMSKSLSDYIAVRATGLDAPSIDKTVTPDPYRYNDDWLSVLGYNAGYIDVEQNNPGYYYSRFEQDIDHPYAIDQATLEVHESGAIDQYDVSFGLNFSDVFMLGGTLTVTDINYDYQSWYDEFFEYEDNDLFLDNGLSTDGTGYGFNLGAIVRAGDYLRFGLAYNSPTWYKLTDYYYGEAASSVTYYNEHNQLVLEEYADNTPVDGAYTDYEFRSPDKWLFSVAAVLGQSALVSVDYELTNYHNMRLYNSYGSSNENKNDDVKAGYGMGSTLRIGAEVKVTPQFAVRAGGAWSNSPLKSDLKNGLQEVYTVGTIPNYTLDKGVSNYTIGLGYRFTPHFYTDLACVFTNRKEDVYAFSPMVNDNGVVFLESQSASMNTKTTRVALTLGYKF